MRIAVVETAAHGGLLHYAVQLADGLAARGHDVEIIAARGNELARRTGRARMRPILVPPTSDSEHPSSRARYFVRRAAIAGRLTRAWLRVFAETRRGRFDAVLLTGDTQLALSTLGIGLLTVGSRRPAVAAICHNVRIFNRWAGDDLYVSTGFTPAVVRWLYPRLDVVFVHGERSLQEFRDIWPPARLWIIPHGDESLFGDDPPPANEPRALFFGEWRKVKGLPVLMEAFDLLAARRPAARLTIAGAPAAADLEPEIVRRWAAEHADRVTVVDHYVPIDDVPALFGSARVVVNPYLTGYQSGVVHLAMTMSRAVVASDVGDLGAAVRDGETGLLVAPGDPVALAAALERLLFDADLAARMGVAGRSNVLTGSSWAAVAERVEQALVSRPDRQ